MAKPVRRKKAVRARRPATIQRFVDLAGGARFRVVAGNGEIVATSEAYTTLSSCNRAIRMLRSLIPDAKLSKWSEASPAVVPNGFRPTLLMERKIP